jgi:hypothetical protein
VAGGGDHDHVEQGEFRGSPGSVPGQDHDVADALRGQVAARLLGQVRQMSMLIPRAASRASSAVR